MCRFHRTAPLYARNDALLLVTRGAPVWLRIERQLGHEMAEYVMRPWVVESYDAVSEGRGGYWEDGGADRYADI